MQWRHTKHRIPPMLAHPSETEVNSDVELEYPTRSIHQDAINEGEVYLADDNDNMENFVAVRPWMGVITPPSAAKPVSLATTMTNFTGAFSASLPEIPPQHLKLGWVHGYNGAELRNQVWAYV